MKAEGNAGEYARRFDLNHATVRSWISEVAKLAYQVGYRLHEDRLVLVGDAPRTGAIGMLRYWSSTPTMSPTASG